MALIAIVDDSRLVRVSASAALKKVGYLVAEIEPTSLGEVMEQLRKLEPGLLLLDQQMPTFLGSSLVRACFEDEALASLKVVMLTAQHDSDIEHRMEKLGVHRILYKPIEPSELTEAVSDLLPAEE